MTTKRTLYFKMGKWSEPVEASLMIKLMYLGARGSELKRIDHDRTKRFNVE